MRDYVETLDEVARRSNYEHTAVFPARAGGAAGGAVGCCIMGTGWRCGDAAMGAGCVETAHWPGAVAP